MQIYVCIKHVPDSAANIHILDNQTIDRNVAFLLNPYDEHAVTEAVALRDQFPGSQVIVVCLARADGEKTLRSALAMGADQGILIRTETDHDPMTTARALKAAIQQNGNPDLIFTGKESIDGENMQTMFRLGALFDFPVVTNAVSVHLSQTRARVEYELVNGRTRACDLALPCVIAAGRGLNTPGYPTFPDVVKARKKPIHSIDLNDLAFEPAQGSAVVVGLEPLVQKRSPQKISGTVQEIAAQLVTILKQEAKVLS